MKINVKFKIIGLFLVLAFLYKSPFIVQKALATPDICTCTGTMSCSLGGYSASCGGCNCVPSGCTLLESTGPGCATTSTCCDVKGDSCTLAMNYTCSDGVPRSCTCTGQMSCDSGGYSASCGGCNCVPSGCTLSGASGPGCATLSTCCDVAGDRCTLTMTYTCPSVTSAPTSTPVPGGFPYNCCGGFSGQNCLIDGCTGIGAGGGPPPDECSSDADCVVPGLPTPTPTSVPPRPPPAGCNQLCGLLRGRGCSGSLSCTNVLLGVCRNPACPDDADCICPNQPPTCLSLSANPISGNKPLTVNFTGSGNDSDGFINQYQWDFDGNGTWDKTTSSNTTSYTYNNEGNYTAKLQVIDDDGDGSGAPASCQKTISVTVNLPPTCLCAVAPTTTTLGNSVQFTGSGSSDSDGSIVSYAWNFGDGTGTSTQTNPVYTYGSIGAFTANLTVTDNNSATSSCGCPQVTVNWATGTISGFAFDDDNGNGCLNGSEGRLDGVVVQAAGSVTRTCTTGDITCSTPGSGEFTFSGLPAGAYTLSVLSYPAGFLGVSGWDDNASCPCLDPPDCRSWTSVALPAGGTAQRQVGLDPNPDPWFQTENGNVHSNNSLTQTIPPDKYFMNGATSSEGVCTAQTSISIGGGKISRRDPGNWKDGSYGTITPPTYATLWQDYKSKSSDFSSWPASVPAGIVRVKSDVTLNTTRWNAISGNPTVIFIGDEAGDGSVIPRNLTITDNLTDKKVILIVSGNVTLNKQVEDIEGIIIPNGTFDTASVVVGQGEDRPLTLTGAVIANQFSLERRRSDNNESAEKFIYNPSFLIDFISLLGKPNYTWQEVAP